MVNTGMMPTFQISPSSPVMQSMTQFLTAGQRKGFGDFRGLLETHIDFAEIASWGPRAGRPVLILGAANVTSGALAKFVSSREAIQVEHILASCAVPSIFPAVQIGADAYWDGLFSDNPPVEELIRPRSMGEANIPDEIWLIKINPTRRHSVPVKPGEIIDRRNQLEGNISLFQQLGHLDMINDMILADAFRPKFLAGSTSRRRCAFPSRSTATPTGRTTSRASRCRSSCRTCWTTRERSIAGRTTSTA